MIDRQSRQKITIHAYGAKYRNSVPPPPPQTIVDGVVGVQMQNRTSHTEEPDGVKTKACTAEITTGKSNHDSKTI